MINLPSLLQSQVRINQSLRQTLIILAKIYKDDNYKHSIDNAIDYVETEQSTPKFTNSYGPVASNELPVINATKMKETLGTIYNMYESSSILFDEDSSILDSLSSDNLRDFEDLETDTKGALLICINTCRRLAESNDKEALTMYLEYCNVLNLIDVLIAGINSNLADLLSIRVVIKLIKELMPTPPHKTQDNSDTNIFDEDFSWVLAAKHMIGGDEKDKK